MLLATRRPGLAFAALLAVVFITAAWWTLALWPVSATAPAWLMTTRSACFGTVGSGLPDAGGWILLIGEPLGMVAALAVVWGENLRADLLRLMRARYARFGLLVLGAAVATGVFAAGRRVASAKAGTGDERFAVMPPLPPRSSSAPPPLSLRDQHGGTTTLADARGGWTIVVFAFGHCETVCPLIVNDVLRARREQHAQDVRVFVVTLDPWRDTPDRLSAIAAGWGLGARDRVLSGEVVVVNQTLDAWGIARRRDANTGNIDHGSAVFVLNPDGNIAWRLDGAPMRVAEALKQR